MEWNTKESGKGLNNYVNDSFLIHLSNSNRISACIVLTLFQRYFWIQNFRDELFFTWRSPDMEEVDESSGFPTDV